MKTRTSILRSAIMFLFGFISVCTFSQDALKDTYPVPAYTDKLLFYLQRSKDKNTIMYELNTLPDGTPNMEEPIHAYWYHYDDGGIITELTYIQKKLAFGINAEITDRLKGNFALTVVSYKSRTLFLQKRLINNVYKYRVFMVINGKISMLQSVFVNVVDNFLYYPTVKNVELYGIDAKTGGKVFERIDI
jgi:hypothetical protein